MDKPLLDASSGGHDECAADIWKDFNKLQQWLVVLSFVVGSTSVILVGWSAYDTLAAQQQLQFRRSVLLASIPIVALLFTWFHIWLAIQMMFRPIKFFGIWQYRGTGVGIGWQGVVPRKAEKMARTAFRCARPYLLAPRDWFTRVNPQALVSHIRPHLEQIIDATFKSVARKHFPDIERRLPPSVSQEFVALAFQKIHEMAPLLWEDVATLLCDSETGLDNDGMIVKVFVENKVLLNHFFLTMGEREFRFIEHCGAALGFICGFIQLIAFNALDQTGRLILLPLTGLFLGIFTNWLALLMCFKPCYPRNITMFGRHIYTVQGLFLKRQAYVSQLYSKMLVEHFFNFPKVIEYLQTQPELWRDVKDVYIKHNLLIFRESLGPALARLAPMLYGQNEYSNLESDIKLSVIERVAQHTELQRAMAQYMALSADIYRYNCRAMQAMPPDRFEDLLHPVFQEDEWILITLGGVLGAVVGIAQVHFLSE